MDQNAAAEQSKPKNAKPVRSESEEYEIRTTKLQAMQEEGKDPFTEVRFDRTNYTTDITENFEEMEGKIVRLAGRMMSKRIMGQADLLGHHRPVWPHPAVRQARSAGYRGVQAV